VARTERCPTCLGIGEVEIPSIQEKLVNHMILSQGKVGVGLAPAEVAELLDALGVSAPEVSGDAGQV
jgi:hypothetical protein